MLYPRFSSFQNWLFLNSWWFPRYGATKLATTRTFMQKYRGKLVCENCHCFGDDSRYNVIISVSIWWSPFQCDDLHSNVMDLHSNSMISIYVMISVSMWWSPFQCDDLRFDMMIFISMCFSRTRAWTTYLPSFIVKGPEDSHIFVNLCENFQFLTIFPYIFPKKCG